MSEKLVRLKPTEIHQKKVPYSRDIFRLADRCLDFDRDEIP
jgi:hypothetical protein